MKSGLFITAISAAAVLHLGQQSGSAPALLELSPPAGARIVSRMGPGQSQPVRSVGISYRLNTTTSVADITEHYAQQITSSGWKQVFRQVEPTLSAVRFSFGGDNNAWTATLSIVPFVATKQAVVFFRAVRSGVRWPEESGRVDVAPLFLDLAGPLTVPATVVRFGNPSGGGTPAYAYGAVRLETKTPTDMLMADLQKQVASPDWTVDARVGDSVQSIVRRSSAAGGHAVEVWILTTMPDRLEVDAILTTMCSSLPTAEVSRRQRNGTPGSAQCREGR